MQKPQISLLTSVWSQHVHGVHHSSLRALHLWEETQKIHLNGECVQVPCCPQAWISGPMGGPHKNRWTAPPLYHHSLPHLSCEIPLAQSSLSSRLTVGTCFSHLISSSTCLYALRPPPHNNFVPVLPKFLNKAP